MTTDRRASLDDVVAELRDGMTIGIGGWGSRRKPMAFVRAIARSPVRDLTLVSYGGPDVGLLCAAGKIRKLVFGFVTLDSIPIEPHFRRAREAGEIEVAEYDEGMIYAGLEAAARRLPFAPVRAGPGTDVMRVNPDLRMVKSPYGGEEVVAMPPLHLDAAFVHMNRADARGNAQFLGPDLYFDDLFLGAASRRFVGAEKIVPTEELTNEATFHTLRINRMMVDAVVEAPGGAHFTSCEPDYKRDEVFQKEYAAADPSAWEAFEARFIAASEAQYQAAR